MMHEDYDDLQAAPSPKLDPNRGIDIRQRQAGEVILVETDAGIYELTLIQPAQRLVEVTGTDPRLHTPVVGCLVHSTSVFSATDRRDGWIGPARRLLIKFRNANFESGVVVAATIRGQGWHFDVF